MKSKTANRIWFIFGIAFGVGVIGWGIASKYLYPTTDAFNLNTAILVATGGFIVFIVWFARTFVDKD